MNTVRSADVWPPANSMKVERCHTWWKYLTFQLADILFSRLNNNISIVHLTAEGTRIADEDDEMVNFLKLEIYEHEKKGWK